MPAATATGTDNEASNTGPAEGNSAHTDTERPLTPSPTLVCAPSVSGSASTDRVICEGLRSASPKVTPVEVMEKPALEPVTLNLSDSPATLSLFTVSEKEPEPDAASPLIVTSKVLSTME